MFFKNLRQFDICRFTTLSALIQHERDNHNIKSTLTELTFTSIHSFLEWKKQVEIESNSQYIQRCSKQTSKTSTRWYYYCNRSGKYVPQGVGKRSLKSQGTNKIGFTCPAHMKAVRDNSCETVQVEYYDGHNHDISLGHLSIPEETRLLIARKLKKV